MAIDGTIVVDFGESVSSSELLVIELDDQVNVDSAGEVITSFAPGEEVGFVVHFDPAVLRIDRVEASCGRVDGGNLVTRERTAEFTFTNTDTSLMLKHIPEDEPEWNWRQSGTAVADYERVNSPVIARNGRELRATGRSLPAIGEARYNISCVAWRFIPPELTLGDDEQWKVVVCVYVEAV